MIVHGLRALDAASEADHAAVEGESWGEFYWCDHEIVLHVDCGSGDGVTATHVERR